MRHPVLASPTAPTALRKPSLPIAFPRLAVVLAALACFGLPGCNSGSDSGSSGGDGFTAKIEGKAWAAAPISISAQVGFGVPGALLMVGSATDGGLTRSITITIYNVHGPGEYILGVDENIFGGSALVGEGTGSGGDALVWATPDNGRAGTFTIKSIGSGRVAGTFAYTTEPGVKNTTATTRTVTEGAFDLPYTGTFVPAPESKGSLATATLNKKSYTAASANARLKDFTGGPGITITTLNSENGYSLILQGVTAKGTYPINNMSPNSVSIVGGRNGNDPETCCWQSANAGSTGTIVITDITATRIKGTFTGNLKPNAGKPATSDLLIEDGAFDLAVSP
jgi:hypothetical protein